MAGHAGGAPPPRFRLVSLNTPPLPDVLLREGGEISIGRLRENTVAISERQEYVSARHLKIMSTGGGDVFLLDLSTNGTWVGSPGNMTKVGHQGKRALYHGCCISLVNPLTKVVEHKMQFRFECLEDAERKQKEETARWGRIAKEYSIGRQLGKGTFATVYHAQRLRDRREEAAVKVIDKKKLAMDQDAVETARLLEEVNLLQRIDHPNVVKIKGVFDDNKYLCIVLEYVRAGDLFDYIINSKFTEGEARLLFTQLLEALLYLHHNHVVHRDLKPANVLVDTPATFPLPVPPPGQSGYGKAQVPVNQVTLKLTDFGIAKWTGDRATMVTYCGTPIFIAPEVQKQGSYTLNVDMWSIGVILYVLITGVLPKNPHAGVQFPEKHWGKVSVQGRDLVAQLLTIDPARRVSLYGICGHPWMAGLTIRGRELAKPPPPAALRAAGDGPVGAATASASAASSTASSPANTLRPSSTHNSFSAGAAGSDGHSPTTAAATPHHSFTASATAPLLDPGSASGGGGGGAAAAAASADPSGPRATSKPHLPAGAGGGGGNAHKRKMQDPSVGAANRGGGDVGGGPHAHAAAASAGGETARTDGVPPPKKLKLSTSSAAADAPPTAPAHSAVPAGDASGQLPPIPVAPAPRWYWKSCMKGADDDGASWTEYQPSESTKIETAFGKNQKTVKVNQSYRVEFRSMVQIQVGNATRKRSVRRVPPA